MREAIKRIIFNAGLGPTAKRVRGVLIRVKDRFLVSIMPVLPAKLRLSVGASFALSLIAEGKLDEASQVIETLQKDNLDHPLLAWGQGILLRRAAQYEQAISVLSKWDDERLQTECRAAENDIHRREITTLLAKIDYAAVCEYISAHKDEMPKPENIDLLMQGVSGAKHPGIVNELLNTLCKDFLPELEVSSDPLLVQLYKAVCAVHDNQSEMASQIIAGFVQAVDGYQTYLWSDHIRSVGIYFLNIQMATECTDLFDVLHRSSHDPDTAASRYNHGYSMIAYARLNDTKKVQEHGGKRLHILQSTPVALLTEVFGRAARPVCEQLQNGVSPTTAAQTLTDALAGKLPSTETILETVDICLTQIPAMLSFQRTYSINPLRMGDNVKPVMKLQEDIACLYAQCETALLMARKLDGSSIPVLERLLRLYLFQEQFKKAGAIRATLAPLIESSNKIIEITKYDLWAENGAPVAPGQQRVPLLAFDTWLRNAGCQNAQVICQSAEKVSHFPLFETLDPTEISYAYTAPELRIGDVENVICLDGGVAINAQMQAIADDFQFPECAALPRPTIAASGRYALLRTARPHWSAPGDCAAFLDMPIFRNEFYHTVAQYLSRLALLQKQGLLEGRALLMPDTLGGGAYAVLDAMGIPRERLVLAPSGHDIHLSRALMPSPSFEMRKPQTAELDALREAILKRHGARAPQDQKIYISRKHFNNRILTNEPELEEIARALGYAVVQPETLPFADQVDLFSRAKVIVGSTGAGLVNMIHAPPGATVVCMTLKDHAIDFWPIMAEGLGHDFAFLAGQSFFPNAPVQVQTFDFKVDLAVFKSILSRY